MSICCYCDAPLSCAACGVEQPSDDASSAAETTAWVDASALQAAREIAALDGSIPACQKIATIQTIVAREMMRASGRSL